MKVKDLIYEVRIFQHQFVKTDLIKNELFIIFGNDLPVIDFDDSGLFIIMDNFQIRDYENSFAGKPIEERKFFLSDGGVIDEIKNIKKYYVEFTRPIKDDNEQKTAETNTETSEPEPAAK